MPQMGHVAARVVTTNSGRFNSGSTQSPGRSSRVAYGLFEVTERRAPSVQVACEVVLNVSGLLVGRQQGKYRRNNATNILLEEKKMSD